MGYLRFINYFKAYWVVGDLFEAYEVLWHVFEAYSVLWHLYLGVVGFM